MPFSDIDGSPLNEGFIFIGEENKDPVAFPVPVFWDEAKTIAVEQPIRTRNGYIINGNVFSKLYADISSCSVLVRNRNHYDIFVDQKSNLFSSFNTSKALVQAETDRAMLAEVGLSTAINNEVNRATGVEGGLQAQINSNGVGNRAYKTYADMIADVANIPPKSKVTVTNDSDSTKNGDYQYDGTTFTKSIYDPVLQAKTYTDLRVLRAAWQVVGQVIKQRTLANGTTEEITITDLSFNKGGAGDGGVRARGGTYTIPRNQALYVDLNDTPDAQARITPKLTTSTADFGWIASAEGIGAFNTDKRIFLFINDAFGFGGGLVGKSRWQNKRNLGDVWIAAAGNVNVTYNYDTKTLAWDNSLFFPMFGLQRRFRLNAGSVVLSAIGTAWIDLSLAASNGDLPPEAIKFGPYGTSDSSLSYEALPHQVPIYVYNANVPGKHYPVGGFPKPTEPSPTTSTLSDDDVVVIGSTDATTGLQVINVYMKGTKPKSTKYIHWLIKRVTLPKDPGQEASNMDAYRIDATYEVDKVPDSISFTPSRSGRALAVGEFSCAIRENGKPDYSGGAHGDEYQENYSFLVDGVPKSLGSGSSFVCKRFELIQVSHVLGHMQDNLSENINFNRTLHLTFEKQRMNQKQQIRWVKSIVVRTAYQAMLPIRRLIQVTTGEQITTTAMRSQLYQLENVSVEGFPMVFTFGYLPEAKIWGDTGISAQIIPKKYPSIASCNFYISNPNLYNKFYFSLAGEDSGAAGALRYTTTAGEVWDSEFDFIFDTTL